MLSKVRMRKIYMLGKTENLKDYRLICSDLANQTTIVGCVILFTRIQKNYVEVQRHVN